MRASLPRPPIPPVRPTKAGPAPKRPLSAQAARHLQLLQRGIDLYRAGKFVEAEYCYQLVLRDDPGHPEALNCMGTLAVEAHRMDKSIEYLEKAARLRPKDANFRNNLGNAYLMSREPDQAIPHLRRAVQLQPDFPEALCNLGRAYGMTGRAQEAEVLFQRVLTLRPAFPTARIGRGEALIELGKMEEAALVFRDVIKEDGPHVPAYVGLATARKHKPGDPEIEAIQSLIDTGGLTNQQMVVLLHAAGKIYDDIKAFDRAFACLSEAKQRMNASFDIEEYGGFIDRSCEAFTAELFAERTDFGIDTDRPVFIVGMPRSGTTLTEQIVSSHPLVHGAGELRHIREMAATLDGGEGFRAAVADKIAGLGRKDSRRLAHQFLAELNRHSVTALRVVDKMPHNFQVLGFIALLFPNARIIHCRRNPVDTCLSCFIQHFSRSHSYNTDLEMLGRYYREYDRLMTHWKAVLPLSMIDVHYEELVADQEGASRRLIEFLGLDWDESVLAFHKTERAVKTPSRWQVRQPIYTSSMERWRNYEKHLGPLIDSLGELAG